MSTQMGSRQRRPLRASKVLSPSNIELNNESSHLTAKKSLSLSSRFSSGDLSSELGDEPTPTTGLATVGRQDSSQNYQGLAERPLQSQPQPMPPPSQPVPGAPPPGSDLSLNLRPSSRTTSAPSSPAKTRESLLQRVQSLTGAARDQSTSPKDVHGIRQLKPETMQEDNISEPNIRNDEESTTPQPFLFVNANEHESCDFEETFEYTQDVKNPQITQILDNGEAPSPAHHGHRVKRESVGYPAAFRLHVDNICAEAIQSVMFDSLEGQMVWIEYQQNERLSNGAQKKLCNILLNRTDKSMGEAEHVHNYITKLTEAIVELMPNEDPNTYYIPHRSTINNSTDSSGKLMDKWRTLCYQLKIRGLLQEEKSKETTANTGMSLLKSKARSNEDDLNTHLKSLQMLKKPLSEVIVHWDATFEYRNDLRSARRNLSDILVEWPILNTGLGPLLVELEFDKLFQFEELPSKWTNFFNCLYKLRKGSIRECIGKEFCKMYDKLNSDDVNVLSGIQIQLLPHLVPTTIKIKMVSGLTIRPTIWECCEDFVIYSQMYESISQKLEHRSKRYKNWGLPAQPCLVFRGPQPYDIKESYVNLQGQLWKLESPLRALDLAFKLYQVFNLHYPADCEHLWVVIQRTVYDIATRFDNKSAHLRSLTNMLNANIQGKRRKTN